MSKHSWNRERRKWFRDWKDEKKKGPCTECGQTFPPIAMDFHHIDPSTKLFEFNQSNATRSEAVLLEELTKCVLLCAVCHRITGGR